MWTGEQAPMWRGSKLPRHCHPYTDSPAPEGRGRRICKEAISSPGGKLPSEEIAANPAYTPPGSIEVREGLRALSRSPGVECGGAARRDYVERFVRLPGTAGGRGDGCGAHRGGFTKLYIISPRIAIDRRARRCYNPSNPVCYSGFEAVTAIFVRNLHKCACIISAMHL